VGENVVLYKQEPCRFITTMCGFDTTKNTPEMVGKDLKEIQICSILSLNLLLDAFGDVVVLAVIQ
jgi:hypothetical protein